MNPQINIAEDNAFFPSEYSLSQYTSPVSDLDGVDYPKPYRGKHKMLMIAADGVASLNVDSEYAAIFVPGGHGALIGLPESQDVAAFFHG
ncbi:hypothetical protein EYW98_19925 [Escherichia coli]|nr:hypothetical protein [Escherichia coli]EGO8379192.1 hypothetical protein [Escherichia coli]